mmetsp:Transcript_30727/g.64703  ORF Transcript_30727/g.64703 Transcript_30727/m.64703 type:complete len:211 (-) Transcript_30727:2237-2869(-)
MFCLSMLLLVLLLRLLLVSKKRRTQAGRSCRIAENCTTWHCKHASRCPPGRLPSSLTLFPCLSHSFLPYFVCPPQPLLPLAELASPSAALREADHTWAPHVHSALLPSLPPPPSPPPPLPPPSPPWCLLLLEPLPLLLLLLPFFLLLLLSLSSCALIFLTIFKLSRMFGMLRPVLSALSATSFSLIMCTNSVHSCTFLPPSSGNTFMTAV